jgi:hypothetical protein
MDVDVHSAPLPVPGPVSWPGQPRADYLEGRARPLLIRFTEAIHLHVSVNRFSPCGVKAWPHAGPLSAEVPLGLCPAWRAGTVAAAARLVEAGKS